MKPSDYARLDHFLGFSSYNKIAKGKPAREGSFSFGPGLDLFRAAYQKLGPLPFIAEDLGVITPAVRALIAETGIPGMDIVQFSDGDVREGYEPKPDTVTFTGTHDNQTLLGFCQSRFGLEGQEATQMADRIAASVLASKNDVAIMPLQDVLGLDDAARMNVPGVAATRQPAASRRWRRPPGDPARLAPRRCAGVPSRPNLGQLRVFGASAPRGK